MYLGVSFVPVPLPPLPSTDRDHMERMTLGEVSTPRFVVLLKAARGYHVVDVRAILYVRAETRYSRIVFTDASEKVVFHSMRALEILLGCGKRIGELWFVRSHKSCIVALHHALELDRESGVLLRNKDRLPISRGEWAGLMKERSSIDDD